MNAYLGWFRWSMVLGFLVTNFFALPGIFWPAAVADLIGAHPPREPVWLAFGFLLSFLVSWFYLPAAIATLNNLPTAWIAVIGRFVTASFWLLGYPYVHSGPRPWLGWVDLVLGIVQLVLLVLVVRKPSVPST